MTDITGNMNDLSFIILGVIYTIYFVTFTFRNTEYNISYLHILYKIKLTKINKGTWIVFTVLILLNQILELNQFNIVDLPIKLNIPLKEIVYMLISGVILIVICIKLIIIISYLFEFSDLEKIEEMIIEYYKSNSKKIKSIPMNSEKISYMDIVRSVFSENKPEETMGVLNSIDGENTLKVCLFLHLIDLNYEFEKEGSINYVELVMFGLENEMISKYNKRKFIEKIGLINDIECKKLIVENTPEETIFKYLNKNKIIQKADLEIMIKKLPNDYLLQLALKENMNVVEMDILTGEILKRNDDLVMLPNLINKLFEQVDSKQSLNIQDERIINMIFKKSCEKENAGEYLIMAMNLISDYLLYEVVKNKFRKNTFNNKAIYLESLVLKDQGIDSNSLEKKKDKISKLAEEYLKEENTNNLNLHIETLLNLIEENIFILENTEKLYEYFKEFTNKINNIIQRYNLDFDDYKRDNISHYIYELHNKIITIRSIDFTKLNDEEHKEIIECAEKFYANNKELIKEISDDVEKIDCEELYSKTKEKIEIRNQFGEMIFIGMYDTYFSGGMVGIKDGEFAYLADNFKDYSIPNKNPALMLNIYLELQVKYNEKLEYFRWKNMLPDGLVRDDKKQIAYMQDLIDASVWLEKELEKYKRNGKDKTEIKINRSELSNAIENKESVQELYKQNSNLFSLNGYQISKIIQTGYFKESWKFVTQTRNIKLGENIESFRALTAFIFENEKYIDEKCTDYKPIFEEIKLKYKDIFEKIDRDQKVISE